MIVKQKYFYILIAFCAFQITSCVAQTGSDNLIQNSGFETGVTHWNIPANTAKVVGDESHSGKQSLHYINDDPASYKMFTQRFKAQPGKLLLFSAWIKGRNVGSSKNSQGAGIYMQSYDTSGTYIKGFFPRTLTGTFDWTLVKGEYLVPDNAAEVSVGVYLRKSVTGEVWFDDVDVHYGKTEEFTTSLHFPNYHGMVQADDATPWQIDVSVKSQPEWKNNPIHLETLLEDTTGKVLLQQSDTASPTEKSIILTVKKHPTLPPGEYLLKQQITNPNGVVTLKQEFPLHVVKSMPEVYIDAQGFCVVHGKRFFPLGMYTGDTGAPGDYRTNSRDIDLQRMADAGFNTVLSYSYARDAAVNGKEFLDLAQKNHLQVIYSLKDMYDGHAGYPQKGVSGAEAASQQVRNLRNHPALLAWYTNDEMKDDWLKEIQKRYNQIMTLDPVHPVYIVSNSPANVSQFYFMSDVLGMDPYPLGVPGRDFDIVTDWTKDTTTASRNTKGVWQVLQMYNPIYTGNKTRQDHQPTLTEMRNMTYQALINGSKGLLYYAYHWLFFDLDKNGKRIYSEAAFKKRWPDVQKLVQEIKPLTDVILKDDKVDLKVLSPSTVQYQAWQEGNKLYIMTANTEDKNSTLQLQVRAGYHLSNSVSGIQAQLQDGVLKLNSAPLASGTIILER